MGPVAAERYRQAREEVEQRIGLAAARSGREAAAVTLLAVSKTVAVPTLRSAIEAGLVLFGENRVQEAAQKAPHLPGAHWHLVGRLQANKAARALGLFEVIQSIDSVALAQRLDRLMSGGDGAGVRPDGAVDIYLQANVDDDASKAGFSTRDLREAIAELADLPHLRILGLMTVGRQVSNPEEARSTFRRLRELSERLRARVPALGRGLSMGMSDDFEVAVEEGATIVRVGRALFGERPLP